MAVLAIISAADLTREIYDAITPVVNWKKDPAPGLIFHACAFDEQGVMHVADVWESAQHMQDFFVSRLGPALAMHAVNLPPPAIYPLHNLDIFNQALLAANS